MGGAVGPAGEQLPGDLAVAGLSREHQRRAPLAARLIGVGASLEQQRDDLDLAAEDRIFERRRGVDTRVDVGAGVQQIAHLRGVAGEDGREEVFVPRLEEGRVDPLAGQKLGDVNSPLAECAVICRVPEGVSHLRIRARGEQQLHARHAPGGGRLHERCSSGLVLRVEVGAPIDEHLGGIHAVGPGGRHQRRAAPEAGAVDARPLVEEDGDHGGVAAFRRNLDRIQHVAAADVHVGPALEQLLDNGDLALANGFRQALAGLRL